MKKKNGQRRKSAGQKEFATVNDDENSAPAADAEGRLVGDQDPIAFLRALRPQGPWVICCFDPRDAKTPPKIEVVTKAGIVTNETRSLLVGHNRTHNVFVQMGAVVGEQRRVGKEAIGSHHYLWVDLDPSHVTFKDDCLRRLAQSNLKELGVPQPTLIGDRGSGFHAYWKLREAFTIDGDPNRCAEFEERLRWLCDKLGGDPKVIDAARVMRVLGTTNIPDAHKVKKKGRIGPLPTRIIGSWDIAYDLADFGRVVAPTKAEKLPSKVQVAVPSKVEPIANELDEYFPDPHHDRIKAMLIHGEDPDSIEGWRRKSSPDYDRSNLIWWVLCECVRLGDVSDEAMVRIQLDPALPLTGHQTKQPKPIAYAVRQLERAKARVGRKYALTDVGNSWRLLDLNENNLRYCFESKSWYVWDGRRWAEDGKGRIEQLAKEVPIAIMREATDAFANSTTDEARSHAESILKWGLKSQSKDRLRAIPEVARAEVAVKITEFDTDPWQLNVANGTLDLRAGTLGPHSREDLNTKLIDVKYDAEAQAPEFQRFLARIMGEEANAARAERLVKFHQRALGYTLTGLDSEQSLFMLHGEGSNGKTTLVEVVKAVLGDYARVASLDTFVERGQGNNGPREDIARLYGARFVSASESGEDQRFDEKLIKEITGGGTMTARHLYQKSFEFRPTFKVWFALNHLPDIRGQDFAIWRRPKAIPYTVTIPKGEQDKTLGARIITNELPGVLAFMVQGCLDWQRIGLAPPKEVEAYTQEYREQVDRVGPFLKERCVTIEKDVGIELAKDIYDAYVSYCYENGEIPLKQTTFGKRMKQKGHPSDVDWDADRGKSMRFQLGIRLQTPAEAEKEAKRREDEAHAAYMAGARCLDLSEPVPHTRH